MLYKLTAAEVKEKMIDFSKTYYGKSVFTLSYVLPVAFLLFGIFGMFWYYCEFNKMISLGVSLVSLTMCLFTLISGTRYYYKEFRHYIEREEKEK